MNYNFQDLAGRVFGRWTVVKYAGGDAYSRGRWQCECICGKKKVIHSRHLKSGKSKSCGCLMRKKGTAFRNLLCQYKNGAKERQLVFKLDARTFRQLTSASCSYCGQIPTNIMKSAGGEVYTYNGIDRSDGTLGYTKENCRTCCWPCNKFKGTRNTSEFLNHVQRIMASCLDLKK